MLDVSESDHVPRQVVPAPQAAVARTTRDIAAGLQASVGNRATARLLQRSGAVRRAGDPAPPAATTGLIVDDGVTDLRPEQLHRTDFVSQAQAAARQGAGSAAGPIADRVEPQVNEMVARYAGQSAAQLEATVRAEVAGAAAAATAPAMITAIRETSGNEARSQLAQGVSDEATKTVDAVTGSIASVASSIGSLLFKKQNGVAPSGSGANEVGQARAQLGRGDVVPSELRGEVERITGTNLSAVRVHMGDPAQRLAGELGARAFTVGDDIVVGSGEPDVGTPEGDALLAHELAHAAQQQGGPTETAPKSDRADHDDAEVAADDVAVEAVAGRWTGMSARLADMGGNVATRLKSGLRLQRCSKPSKPGPTIADPTKEALNRKVLEKMQGANASGGDGSKGVHYPFNYKQLFEARWKALGEPADGYADPSFWKRIGYMHWIRLPGVSASAALDAWFRGPTIAECATVAVASEISALRAALGDANFDKLFGDEGHGPRDKLVVDPRDPKRNVAKALEIGQEVPPILVELMRNIPGTTGVPGQRKVTPGEWHYFANHPKYPAKHPAGFWRGENALYQGEEGGKQMWNGFGATEDEKSMNQTLVDEYNKAVQPEDTAKMGRIKKEVEADPSLKDGKYKEFFGDFPDRIDVPALLAAGGGFDSGAGQELDPAKVKALRDRSDLQ